MQPTIDSAPSIRRFRHDILSALDIRVPWTAPRALWFGAIGMVFLLMAPMLFFPLGHDEAIFFVSGQKIVHQGAIHYRDMIDIKPPLIYYIYAVGIALFGDGAASIRIVDLVIQGMTAVLMMSIVRRASGNDLWAIATGLLYAVVYVAESPAGTAHVESYAALLGFGMIYLQMFRRTRLGFLVIGLLGGLLFMLKFTLGILLGGVVLAELLMFRESWRRFIVDMVMAGVGFGIVIGLFFLYLVAFDAYAGFQQMQQFTAGYTNIQWQSKGTIIKRFLKISPIYLGDNYSLFLLILTALGTAFSLTLDKRSGSEPPTIRQSRALLQLCTIAFVLMLVTVGIEGKYGAYQFHRLYSFGVVLSTFGLLTAARYLHQHLRWNGYTWLLMAGIATLCIGFSPLTRYIYHSGGAAVGLVKGPAALDRYYDQLNGRFTRGELKEMGDYIVKRRGPNDHLFAASGYGGLVHFYASDVPEFKLYQAAFLMAPFSPAEWKQETADYLINRSPRFVALHTTDSMPDITESFLTSEQAVFQLPGVEQHLKSEYTVAIKTVNFDLYERKTTGQ